MRAVQISLVRERIRIEAEAQLRDRANGAPGVPLVDTGNHLVVREGPAKRLPGLRCCKRPGDRHRQVAHGQAIPAVYGQFRVGFQLAHRGERQGGGDVRISPLDQAAAGFRLHHHAHDDTIEVISSPAAPVPIMALQDDAGFHIERGDPVGSGAQPLAVRLRPGVAPVAIDRMRLQRGGVDDGSAVIPGEGGEEERLRLFQVEHERARIRGRDLGGILDEAPEHAGRRQAEGEQPREGCLRGGGIQQGAVLEADAIAQAEGPAAGGGVRLPRFRQDRLILVHRPGPDPDQAFEGALQEDARPRIVDRVRIEV